MKTILGRVVDGKIEAGDLKEGELVVVLAPDEEGFELTPEQEDELSAAMAEVEAGSWIDGETLLRDLREMTRR